MGKRKRGESQSKYLPVPDFMNDEPVEITTPLAKQLIPSDIFELKKQYKLNLFQYRFIAVYCYLGFQNEGIAYRWAGYKVNSDHAACNGARRLLAKTSIQAIMKAYAEFALAPYTPKIQLNLMETHYKRAFYDPAIFMDQNTMQCKKLGEIPPEWRICIDQIENKFYGKDADVCSVKYVLADRNKALDQLAKYVNWIKTNTDDIIPDGLADQIKKAISSRKGENTSPALKLLEKSG